MISDAKDEETFITQKFTMNSFITNGTAIASNVNRLNKAYIRPTNCQ